MVTVALRRIEDTVREGKEEREKLRAEVSDLRSRVADLDTRLRELEERLTSGPS